MVNAGARGAPGPSGRLTVGRQANRLSVTVVAVEMTANDRVALAGRRFQSFAVPHGDPPMRVADQASLLQCGAATLTVGRLTPASPPEIHG